MGHSWRTPEFIYTWILLDRQKYQELALIINCLPKSGLTK